MYHVPAPPRLGTTVSLAYTCSMTSPTWLICVFFMTCRAHINEQQTNHAQSGSPLMYT